MSAQLAAQSPREILSVQYLRGVAALMVVWHHAAGQVPGMAALLPWRFGTSGVDLFFVISGFIMVVTTAGSRIRPVDFWRRRIVRVVPLYWLLTLLMVALALAAPGLFKTLKVAPDTLLQSLFFVPHFSHSFPEQVWPLLIPGWTLNFEMFFYAVFGASLWLPERSRFAALTACFLVLSGAGLVFGPFASAAAQTYTHPMLLEFLAGIWIGVWWSSRERRLSFGVSLLMLFCGAFLLLLRDTTTSWSYLPQIAGASVAVAGALHPRFSSWRSVLWRALGDSSYSLYLTHLFTLGVLRVVWVRLFPSPPDTTAAVAFLLISLLSCGLVGWCTYRGLELPLLERLKTGAVRSNRVAPRVR